MAICVLEEHLGKLHKCDRRVMPSGALLDHAIQLTKGLTGIGHDKCEDIFVSHLPNNSANTTLPTGHPRMIHRNDSRNFGTFILLCVLASLREPIYLAQRRQGAKSWVSGCVLTRGKCYNLRDAANR